MRKWLYSVCLLLLIPNIVLAQQSNKEETTKEEIEENKGQNPIIVKLEKCIDGDTAKFKSADGTVITYRFLAINAPELANLENKEEKYALEASQYTCDKLTKAEEIKLEFDENASEKDAYNRGLAWVFVDDSLLQEELIEKGYAKVGYLYKEYKYNSILKEKEAIAKKEKVGLWKEDVKKQPTIEEKVKEKTGNALLDFANEIIENLLASFNHFVDSILQKVEDML